ncbi:MAG: bifunctional UDP-N-acetylglucosamine diphosphorylase/glucosamine-1-phosphate N-acetyltransferase GlmU [Bryobacteraceae bacterium]|jgi:bifunctional UDP-N-acetylglucosamine pyrophosphorylase/glucosamine-1-phosphate N-acetyltransferase
MSSSPVSVVILAAGLGTRMRSRLAKVLHRAGGECLLEHVIEAAREIAPAERIVAVVGHQAERVRAEVERSGVRFAVQTEQKGTGHALGVCAGLEGLNEGRIVVLYGDCPLLRPETLRHLMRRHEEAGCAATLITTCLDDPTGYGRVIRDSGRDHGRGQDEAGHVRSIVEEKAASAEQKQIREINSGLYCFEAALLWKHLAALQPNPASGEIYLTDIVAALRGSGHATAACVVDDPGEILGINTRVELAEADRILRQRKARELMLAGVTIERPETVSIDKHVVVGADTIVGPFAQLLGRTRIGAECRIGAGAILRNAVLGDEAEVLPYSVIDDSTLEARARVGPFARLRMNATVEAKACVGNFVELKNTRLGADSKAMHLAYLGDSVIGPEVNIGAGAITCNYDGVKKHQTLIGPSAFVGSNATLVAPVEIGAGSYVAAGSVITDAVPEDALALGRSRQVVKKGWARKRRGQTGK